MQDLTFSIWMASKTRWVHLTKLVRMPAVPRAGEWIKFRNRIVGDYFPWRVTEITYRESGEIEVGTELLDDVDGRGYSFDEEAEFDEYLEAYLQEGWIAPHGVKPNTRIKGMP
jgi:hypothetical protein